MDELEFIEYLTTKCGYLLLRKQPDGGWAGVTRVHGSRYLLTKDITEIGYGAYWVYPSFVPAAVALSMWNWEGEPNASSSDSVSDSDK